MPIKSTKTPRWHRIHSSLSPPPAQKIHMGVSLHSTKNKRFNARLSSKEKLKFKEGNWLDFICGARIDLDLWKEIGLVHATIINPILSQIPIPISYIASSMAPRSWNPSLELSKATMVTHSKVKSPWYFSLN